MEYVKAVYCHPANLTSVQRSLFNFYINISYLTSTSLKMPGWMKCKPESSFLGEISITSDMQMTPLS